MTSRTISLRAKLVAAVAIVVSAASVPLIYVAYEDTYARAIEAARSKFENVTKSMSDELERTYLNAQTLVVEKSVIEKDDVIAELDAMEEWLRSGRLNDMLPTFAFLAEAWGTYGAVVDEGGEFLTISPGVLHAWKLNPRDLLGIPFREYLLNTGRSFFRDEFTVLRMTYEGRAMTPFLVGVRKSGDHTLVVLQVLDYLEAPWMHVLEELEAHVADGARAVELQKEASIQVVSGDGRRIAGRGEAAQFGEARDALRSEARRQGFASATIDSDRGPMLHAVRYVKPLDWYVEGSLPIEVIAAPTREHARELIGMAIAVFYLVSLAGVFLIAWFLRPMRQLSETAGKMRAVNLVSADAAAQLRDLRRGLPAGHRDEVAEVSKAFGQTLGALADNIEGLKASLARQHHFEGEMKAAREIQSGMLAAPGTIFKSPGFEAYAVMTAARDVGGDFYDVLPLPGGAQALIVGDVSGKGVSAAMLMCVSLTLIRNAFMDGLTPARVMKKVNDQLALRNPTCMFVTLWLGRFDPATGRLDFANGGHCPPLAVSSSGGSDRLEALRGATGPLVGVLEEANFRDASVMIEPDELVLLYTDGVTEAMDPNRSLFGETRLRCVVETAAASDPRSVVEAVERTVREHRSSAEQSDDITMLAFRRLRAETGTEKKEK